MKEKELISQFWSSDNNKKAKLFATDKQFGADTIKVWSVEVKAEGVKKAKTLHNTQEEAENFAETWVLS
tara:strand:- start:1891 stop:2097 length:207 start_codon:yes stop_codon:yes gene_type:complete